METDGICVDVMMVGTWMLCGNGWGLCGPDHGWDMDALWERMEPCGLHHGWDMDAMWKRMESAWTYVIMVGTWMLGGNGWSLCGLDHG